MLPKGALYSPSGGDCPFLIYSRLQRGQVSSIPYKNTPETEAMNTHFVVAGVTTEGTYAWYCNILNKNTPEVLLSDFQVG